MWQIWVKKGVGGMNPQKRTTSIGWRVLGWALRLAWHGVVMLACGVWALLGTVLDLLRNSRRCDDELQRLEQRLGAQVAEYQRLAQAYDGRWWAPDTACIGGTVLVDYLTGAAQVPEAVETAYAFAYPGLAASESFRQAAGRMADDPERLAGFLNGVRGKLFEIQYADYLNAGVLPDGVHAALAPSATQPNWDIAILDDRGNAIEVLQAKATDSVSYVKQALAENPQIDVVTTDEVCQHLALAGGGEGVIESGILDAELTATLADHVSAGDHSLLDGMIPDLLPGIPVTTLALAAFTSYRDPSLTPLRRSASVGDRVGRAVPSYLLATLVAGVLSGPLGAVVVTASAVGVSHFARRGRQRGFERRALRERLKVNDRILRRMRRPGARRKPWGRGGITTHRT